MVLFHYVLILLVAICASNLIHRFLPSVSVPVVQIALGACMTLLPSDFHAELNPELFFILFIAPLVYNSSVTADKKSLWAFKTPILHMAFVLVPITVVAVGCAVHRMIPAIPIAAAFALVAALGPTDDVAVASLAGRVAIPHSLMSVLEGESILNDASGIVSFQFALAAMLTGSFSASGASVRLIEVALGGIAVGLLLTFFKYLFVRWIRSLGMENATLHILIGVLTPFLIYMIAEELGVSGVFAVFASGIAHSFGREKLNPETAALNIASDGVWSVLSFTFDGMVFLILGTQLPAILKTVLHGTFSISAPEVVAYVLILTLLFAGSRFVWALLTLGRNVCSAGRLKTAFIVALAGARGAVSLAGTMSIPLLLNDGTPFPERDLIILVATGVILCSLFLANFVLPAVTGREGDTAADGEDGARLEILRTVIARLNAQVPAEGRSALERVTRDYYDRCIALQHKNPTDREAERRLKATALEWERLYIKDLPVRDETDAFLVRSYLEVLAALDKSTGGRIDPWDWLKRHVARLWKRSAGTRDIGVHELRRRFAELRKGGCEFVLEKLRRMNETEPGPAVDRTILFYELSLSLHRSSRGGLYPAPPDAKEANAKEANAFGLKEVASLGFQIERDAVQAMFEQGRISWKTAKEMRDNLSLLELQIS